MSRSIFGWSYPPGCSGPPDDVECATLRCEHCKGFIGGKPRIEPWESSQMCDGTKCGEEWQYGLCGIAGKHEPHKVVWDQGVNRVFTCKRCGKETKLGG